MTRTSLFVGSRRTTSFPTRTDGFTGIGRATVNPETSPAPREDVDPQVQNYSSPILVPDNTALRSSPKEDPPWCKPASSRMTSKWPSGRAARSRRGSTGATRRLGWCCWRRRSACGGCFTLIPSGSFRRDGGVHEPLGTSVRARLQSCR